MRGGTWGELLSCPDIHSDNGHLVEGVCESGSSYACNGHASEVECCQGHYKGQVVGSTGQCSWMFTGGFGSTLGIISSCKGKSRNSRPCSLCECVSYTFQYHA